MHSFCTTGDIEETRESRLAIKKKRGGALAEEIYLFWYNHPVIVAEVLSGDYPPTSERALHGNMMIMKRYSARRMCVLVNRCTGNF